MAVHKKMLKFSCRFHEEILRAVFFARHIRSIASPCMFCSCNFAINAWHIVASSNKSHVQASQCQMKITPVFPEDMMTLHTNRFWPVGAHQKATSAHRRMEKRSCSFGKLFFLGNAPAPALALSRATWARSATAHRESEQQADQCVQRHPQQRRADRSGVCRNVAQRAAFWALLAMIAVTERSCNFIALAHAL